MLTIKEGSYLVGGKAKGGQEALFYFEPMLMKLPKQLYPLRTYNAPNFEI